MNSIKTENDKRPQFSDEETKQAEQLLSKIQKDLWSAGENRPDLLKNIATYELTAGERRSQEYIEKTLIQKMEIDRPFIEKYARNHLLVSAAYENLVPSGGLAAQIPIDGEYDTTHLPEKSGLIYRIFKGITNVVKENPYAVGFIAFLIGSSVYVGISSSLNPPDDNEPDKTTDSDEDGLPDWYEDNVHHTDKDNPDTDGDYVSDGLEINEFKTNPFKIDTDGGRVDDFNEIFTYGMNATDPKDDGEFMEKIPFVEARPVNYTDGGLFAFHLMKDKIITVSMRDPLCRYYAEKSSIEWMEENGKIIGNINIPDYSHSSGKDSHFPAYEFTHGREGACLSQAYWNTVILRHKGYKTIVLSGDVPYKGEMEGHGWLEAYNPENGEVYVVTWERMHPRDNYYKEKGWILDPKCNYDPNWFKE